jgi:L-ascorbate metabolism protein UlaG (beta-lactamase superfamily)
MIMIYKKTGLLALILLTTVASGQNSQISIRFIGNCGLYLTDGTTNIYIDFPYKSGAYHYMEYSPSELDSVKNNPVFIFTHKHADHYSGRLVKKLAKNLNGNIYSSRNIKKLLTLNTKLDDFRIEAFKTKHRFSIRHCSYLVTWHNKNIFINGDTGQSGILAAQKDVDWAFVPAWIFENANANGIKLKDNCKMLAVYHIGPGDHITNDNNDPRIKLLDKQGEIITIPY